MGRQRSGAVTNLFPDYETETVVERVADWSAPDESGVRARPTAEDDYPVDRRWSGIEELLRDEPTPAHETIPPPLPLAAMPDLTLVAEDYEIDEAIEALPCFESEAKEAIHSLPCFEVTEDAILIIRTLEHFNDLENV